jgi:protein subunit release factor B
MKLKVTDKFVGCTFTQEGTHCWPNAPASVKYLKWSHRHIFHVEVYVRVTGSDREVEFITLKHKAEKAFALLGDQLGDHQVWEDSHLIEFGSQSCEMLAEALGIYLAEKYNYDVASVCVSEDDENGAIVNFEKSGLRQ